MPTKEQILRDLYSAINRNDISAAMDCFDPDIVRIEPEGFPASGTYRGLEEMRQHFLTARETWAEGACNPERFTSQDDKMIVFVHVRVRLKDKTDWIEGHVTDGFTFKDGKIIEMYSFVDSQKALVWAGMSSS